MDRQGANMQNLLPLLGALTNGNTMNNNQNFINQLAAAITSAVGATNSGPTTRGQQIGNNNNRMVNQNVRERTPEAPPAPRFRTNSPLRMQPNRGTAPMDIENEPDTSTHTQSMNNMNSQMPMNNINSQMPMNNINSQIPVGSAPNAGVRNNLPIPNNNMFMNGYMPPNTQQPQQQQAARMDGTPYMFFPAQTPADAANAAAIANAASTSAATAATQAVNQMFMDPTSMMAAMQQMQQNYAASFGPPITNTDVTMNAQNAAIVQAAAGAVMKEVIKFPNSTLFPPPLHSLPPTKRERPPGCRTVFIGGLPENCTEELIREVFESCGEITTLRISKKNFCHIRYELEDSVERAIFYSGYRMRINPTAGIESSNFGRLHVDYAQARDDLHDYECKQRQLEREQRHRDRVSTTGKRTTRSPPPIPPYNEAEAAIVGENLRNNETFIRAIQKISVWLERGDCKKQNANMFYSMLQSTHAHVRRLISEKVQHKEELRQARENYRKQMLALSAQFTQIEKVFNAASHKKVWDHFTKAQRKNIDQWKKLTMELRSVQIEDDEMDMSDDERSYHSSNAKRSRYDAESLREENDSLRCQLDALRGEMSHMRSTDPTSSSTENREGQIQVLQETIRNMQTQLLQTKAREQKDTKIIEKLQINLKEARIKHLLLQTKIKETAQKRRERSSSRDSYTSDERRNDRRYSDRSDDDDDDVQLVRGNNDENSNKRTVNNGKNKNMNANNAGIQDKNNAQIIDIDDDVNIVENYEVVEIPDEEEEGEKEKEKEEEKEKKENDKEKNDEVAEENEENADEKCIDEKTNEQKKSTYEIMLNEEANPADEEETAVTNFDDEKIASQNVSDEKESFAPVETKLMEETQEIEPKFLPFVEAKIIALTAAYLIVQPFGITTESICAYLRQSMDTLDLQTTTLEEILATYTNLFKFEYDAGDMKNGINYDTKGIWKFCGFEISTNELVENDAIKVNKEEIKNDEF